LPFSFLPSRSFFIGCTSVNVLSLDFKPGLWYNGLDRVSQVFP
jgi:hypothetical protein